MRTPSTVLDFFETIPHSHAVEHVSENAALTQVPTSVYESLQPMRSFNTTTVYCSLNYFVKCTFTVQQNNACVYHKYIRQNIVWTVRTLLYFCFLFNTQLKMLDLLLLGYDCLKQVSKSLNMKSHRLC